MVSGVRGANEFRVVDLVSLYLISPLGNHFFVPWFHHYDSTGCFRVNTNHNQLLGKKSRPSQICKIGSTLHVANGETDPKEIQ